MQALITSIAPTRVPSIPCKKISMLTSVRCKIFVAPRACSVRATAAPNETAIVDYSSAISVFPAEACETVGGEACWAYARPEVKLQQSEDTNSRARGRLDNSDREYLEYGDKKTVFPGEACDDLGGEFCGVEYQRGVNQSASTGS